MTRQEITEGFALPPVLLVDNEADDLFIPRRLIAKAGVKNKGVAMEDPPAAIEYLGLEARNEAFVSPMRGAHRPEHPG